MAENTEQLKHGRDEKGSDTGFLSVGTITEPTPVTEPEFPEGGFRAWLVILGSFFACFCAFGYATSFG